MLTLTFSSSCLSSLPSLVNCLHSSCIFSSQADLASSLLINGSSCPLITTFTWRCGFPCWRVSISIANTWRRCLQMSLQCLESLPCKLSFLQESGCPIASNIAVAALPAFHCMLRSCRGCLKVAAPHSSKGFLLFDVGCLLGRALARADGVTPLSHAGSIFGGS